MKWQIKWLESYFSQRFINLQKYDKKLYENVEDLKF